MSVAAAHLLESALDAFDAEKDIISIGDYVQTPFSSLIGTIQNIRESDAIYEISIDSWKLATGNSPILYAASNSYAITEDRRNFKVSSVRKVSSDKFGILSILEKLTALAESFDEANDQLGDAQGLCRILKRFLDAGVIAPRPLYTVYYDRVCGAFLRFVVRLARRTLAKSTANMDFIGALCDHDLGILLPIVKVMAEHMTSDVCHWGCWLFAVLASDSTDRQLLLDSVGAPIVAAYTLHAHFDSPQTVAMACRAIRNLSCVDEIAAKMVQEGAIEGIIEILKRYGCILSDDLYDKDATDTALWAAVNMTCDSEMATIFGSMGGINELVDIFHRIVEELQSAVSVESKGSSESTCQPLLCVLRNVSAASSYNFGILAKTEICNLVVQFLLLDLRSVYSDVSAVSEVAFLLMSNLACSKNLSSQLFSVDGCMSVLMTAINSSHKEDEVEVFEASLWAMRTLSGNNENARCAFLSHNVLEKISSEWTSMSKDGQKIELFCGLVLSLVTDNVDGCERAYRIGLIETVFMTWIRLGSENLSASIAANRVLIECAKLSKEVQDKLLTLDVREHCLQGILNHKQNRELVVSCCELLLRTTHASDDLKAKLIMEGAIDKENKVLVSNYDENFDLFFSFWASK